VRGISDPGRVQTLEALMNRPGPRTAVVLMDAETVFTHLQPGARRALAGALDQWTSGAAGRNTCVLVFRNPTFDGLVERIEAQDYLPQFVTYLRGCDQVADVGRPDQSELARLVQLVRLHDGLAIGSWTELGTVTRTMAAQSSSVQAWHRDLIELAGREPLSLPALRAAGWVSGSLPDGRSAHERLDSLTGLAPVKEFLRRREAGLAADVRLRAEGRGSQPPTSLHLVFTGKPGTGKTTVAEIFGELYRDLGLLRRGHVVAPAVDELVAGYVGQTAGLTRARITEALDGVLFIDEAYRLSDQRDGFGQEAIDVLLADMERHRDRLAVIVAGYPGKMAEFLGSNPGLRSRFPEANTVEFPDFEPAELLAILLGLVRDRFGLTWTPEAESDLRQVVTGLHRTRGDDFGNARTMRELAAELKDRWAVRTRPGAGAPLEPLAGEDVPERLRGHLDAGAVRVEDVLAELDNLVGLDPVKEVVRAQAARLNLRLRRGRTAPVPPHLVFAGGPGTGKTTVARLVGRMLRAMGLLAKGHLVEVTRGDLVAEYVGQTAPRTRAKIHEALDGVLFIDEAYGLADGGHSDFGREAITELTDQMEKLRGRLVVVAAGYPDAMARFLAANDGLGSRFTEHVTFPDYSGPELRRILELMGAAEGFEFAEGTLARAVRWLEGRRAVAGRRFGNARTVRNLFDAMEARLGHRLGDGADDAALNRFEPLDVPEAAP
jgi:AAA+ superfamily predicted ATPase